MLLVTVICAFPTMISQNVCWGKGLFLLCVFVKKEIKQHQNVWRHQPHHPPPCFRYLGYPLNTTTVLKPIWGFYGILWNIMDWHSCFFYRLGLTGGDQSWWLKQEKAGEGAKSDVPEGNRNPSYTPGSFCVQSRVIRNIKAVPCKLHFISPSQTSSHCLAMLCCVAD